MAYAPRSSYWQPDALSQAPVTYPTPAFMPNTAPAPRTPFYRPARVQDADPSNPNTGPRAFGVLSGDFGGSGVFGVKTGTFNMPGDTVWNTRNFGTAGGAVAAQARARAAGGGMGGGGIGGGGSGDLVSEYQQALNRANQANEARYRDALSGYQSRYQRGMDMLNGLGQQEAKDINEMYDNQAAKTKGDLIGRGLGNSTVMNTMLAGVERERAAELGRLNERVRQQAIGTDAGLSGDTLSFMERKNETGPDFQMLAQLAQQLGQGGVGGGAFGLGAIGADAFGGGGGGMPMGGMMPMVNYMPRATAQNTARLAAARANYAARNGLKGQTDWPNQGRGPVSSSYARSWLPTGYMTPAEQAAADAERVANAIGESGAGNPLANPYAWIDPNTGSSVANVGGMF